MPGYWTTRSKRKEFEAVALEHLDALYQMGIRLTRNPAKAQDLVEETYLKAFRSFQCFKPGTNTKVWLFIIFCNAYTGSRRNISTEHGQFDFERMDAVFSDISISHACPEREWTDGIFYDFGLKNLESALYELPEACRLLVLLADPENFSYKEIAGIVGCSRDAVMSGLFHSRRLLLNSLEKLARKSEKIKIEPIAS